MKKIFSIICCILLLFTNYTATYAYSYPDRFWEVNRKYEEALKTKNYSKIIEYGDEIISMMAEAPDGPEKRDILVTRYSQMGDAYAELGDYVSSAKTFQIMYNYAIEFGDTFYDYTRGAKAKVNQYTPVITMYTDRGSSVNYGAVNEKGNGVLFGLSANGETRSLLDNESMLLTYQELGHDLLTYNVGILKTAETSGCAVEFALNCPSEGLDIKNIKKSTSYLSEISELFKQYPKVPVYLRFAAEFDVWTVPADAEKYKTAFRYVSEYFKDRNPNVAIVWSPNQVSSWNIDIDDYYPGDEYVDWVGISLYSQKYFLGDKNQNENSELVFKTGVNSDPVIAVKDIVEKYGNRKPIMISESGCGHTIMGTEEDTSEFALRRLKEMMSYLPMVYPQIKLMAYFDWHVYDDTEKNDFRLSTNEKLQKEYLKLVKGERFIQDGYNGDTGFCYRPVTNGINVNSIFEVSCYAHFYNTELSGVTYFIDDKYAGMSTELPFTTFIDASDYSGKHKLKAIAVFGNGKTLTTESVVFVENDNRNITVKVSGNKLTFDQEPVLYSNRTMVPMRKIFEALGADVTWDNDTQMAIGKKGSRTVKLTVGQKTMYVNDEKVMLDAAPIMLKDRTLVPVRAIAEGLGCRVEWDERNYVVSITPKNPEWSQWSEQLPPEVNDKWYYVETKTEYRFRKREKEYFTLSFKHNTSNYVRTDVSYGSWSAWQDSYIAERDNLEVETRTQSSPKQYHYAHYCTGNIKDSANKYRTKSYWWHDECKYHDLGWFDSPLPYSEDSTSNYAYYVDGKKYRCSNTCFRWYLIETTGGTYTQYRSRPVYEEHIYWQWGEWGNWSYWTPYNVSDFHERGSIDVEERTLYRYKEK